MDGKKRKRRSAKEPKRIDEEIRTVANQIYQRDPQRFRKLPVWINTARKDGWDEAAIRQTLVVFDQRDRVGDGIGGWWRYLFGLLRRLRTEQLVNESDGYKKEDLTSVRSIFRKLAQEGKI